MSRMALGRPSRALVVGLAVLLAGGGAVLASGKPERNGSGRFCGQAISGGEIVPVETRLDLQPDGKLAGTYQFRDRGEWIEGTLSEVSPTLSLTKTLVWADRFGVGWLTLTFDRDFGSFDGRWGVEIGATGLPWNGSLCDNATS
jgi:hypothetical protein